LKNDSAATVCTGILQLRVTEASTTGCFTIVKQFNRANVEIPATKDFSIIRRAFWPVMLAIEKEIDGAARDNNWPLGVVFIAHQVDIICRRRLRARIGSFDFRSILLTGWLLIARGANGDYDEQRDENRRVTWTVTNGERVGKFSGRHRFAP